VLGRLAIERYLRRALSKLPAGAGSSLLHVVGGDMGGGYEWQAACGGAKQCQTQDILCSTKQFKRQTEFSNTLNRPTAGRESGETSRMLL
jgi:hypothetical protein